MALKLKIIQFYVGYIRWAIRTLLQNKCCLFDWGDAKYLLYSKYASCRTPKYIKSLYFKILFYKEYCYNNYVIGNYFVRV